jgi:hypothetical protein
MDEFGIHGYSFLCLSTFSSSSFYVGERENIQLSEQKGGVFSFVLFILIFFFSFSFRRDRGGRGREKRPATCTELK